MLLIAAELFTLAVVSALLGYPILKRPLSEDDGWWFYWAKFDAKGFRPWFDGAYHMVGYFNLQWLFMVMARVFKKHNSTFFYGIKLVWYVLTSLSIYCLVYVLWGDHLVAFLSGLFFTVAWSLPSTKFWLTYAEHMYILPVNLATLCLVFWLQGASWLFLVPMGMLSAIIFQFKISAIVICFGLAIPVLFSDRPFVGLITYSASWVFVTIVPHYLTRGVIREGAQGYLQVLFKPFIVYGLFLLKKSPFSNRIKKKIPIVIESMGYNSIVKDEYIANQYKRASKVSRLGMMRPLLIPYNDLFIVIWLAFGFVLHMLFVFDYAALTIIGMFIAYLLIQQIQRNYYLPHFNMLWAPLSMMAGKEAGVLIDVAVSHPSIICVLALPIIIFVFRIIQKYRQSFSREEVNFGVPGLPPWQAIVWRQAELVGNKIQEVSSSRDRMVVWGDHPALYLYADRLCFAPAFMFVYGHNGKVRKEEKLFWKLRCNSPELLVFYNYKGSDKWNAQSISDRLGIAYNVLQSLVIKVENQNFMDVTICRRDDLQYRFAALEMAAHAEKSGHIEQSRQFYQKVLDVFPSDFEAETRLTLTGFNGDERLEYLECRLDQAVTGKEKAVVIKLIGLYWMDQNEMDKAFALFKESMKLYEKDPESLSSIAVIAYSRGDVGESMRLFGAALRCNKYSSEALNGLGVVLAESGKIDEARKFLSDANAMRPGRADIRNNLKRTGGRPVKLRETPEVQP